MNLAEEKEWITAAVADLRAACQLPEDPLRRGPVRLERFLAEHALRLVELPRLSRAAVYDYLLAKGSIPGDLGEDEDLAGFLYLSGPFGRVFVNADDPVTRRRFTAGHELGHFVLHRASLGGKVSFGDSPATVVEVEDDTAMAMERQANRFAAELLMPASVCRARGDTFRSTYGVCPRGPFAYHLASELVVSPEAMRYRLRDLGVGDE
ncbi:MAG TPA: ImmA/IrrE family metallo-endopeptidase [Gemmataceae bacterium]|nr:ImmA/IrrE family metallo-endopeptidase [Gemmataceae bacterium]